MRAVQSRVGCRRRTDRWGFIAKSFVFVVGLCGRRAAAGSSTAAVGVCHCPGRCAGLGWWRPKACGSATFATSSRQIFFKAERRGVAGEEKSERRDGWRYTWWRSGTTCVPTAWPVPHVGRSWQVRAIQSRSYELSVLRIFMMVAELASASRSYWRAPTDPAARRASGSPCLQGHRWRQDRCNGC